MRIFVVIFLPKKEPCLCWSNTAETDEEHA